MHDAPPPEDAAQPRPLTVSELTRRVKRTLEVQIGAVEVEGEIGNLTVSSRGHAYFSLKDEGAVVSCVLFAGAFRRLGFEPAEGMQVVLRGEVSVYEARGQYQIIVRTMRESGVGELYRRFLQLKDKLEKEGLFDPERKRPLPALPRRIGVVTSATGAALRDILNVLARRSPCVEIILSPCLVQGAAAPADLLRALGLLTRWHAAQPEGLDVAVVGRGGGSIEDLWAFNDERVARALAALPFPVVSAVGHETDFTIADFVADMRAPTPSAAAEIVVAERSSLLDKVQGLQRRLDRALTQNVATRRLELRRLLESWALRQPADMLREAVQRLDELAARRDKAAAALLKDAGHRTRNALGRLEALSPTRVLERGYGIVTLARNGRVVTRARQARPGDHLQIRLSEGEIRAAALAQGEDLFDGVDMEPS